MSKRRVHSPTLRVVWLIRRRQLTCAIKKECCSARGTAGASSAGCFLECGGNRIVGLGNGGCQMVPPCLGIVHKLRKPCVNLRTTPRAGGLVCAGGQKWMRESDAVAVELDDAGVKSWVSPASRVTRVAASTRTSVGGERAAAASK